MDMSFHYFGVKTIALSAGCLEDEAQRIASYSQFVDDYNWYVYFRSGNIPAYIKHPELDIVYNDFLNIINPVTTGFMDLFDMQNLVIDKVQKFTLSPFHFIPQKKENVEKGDNRVFPAVLNDGSYISNMLQDLQSQIDNGSIIEEDFLMQMGVLFHIFADTYSHQTFSGYNNKTNAVQLISVTDNITGREVTEKYNHSVEEWVAKVENIIKNDKVTIGHISIGHIPDLSHLSFTMKYMDNQGYRNMHSRSNTDTFIQAAEQLYNYLRINLEKKSIKELITWNELGEKLREAFLIDVSKELEIGEQWAMKKLTPHWKNVFPNYEYNYNSSDMKKNFVISKLDNLQLMNVDGQELAFMSSDYSKDFYKYSLFANKILVNLYGETPRAMLNKGVGIKAFVPSGLA